MELHCQAPLTTEVAGSLRAIRCTILPTPSTELADGNTRPLIGAGRPTLRIPGYLGLQLRGPILTMFHSIDLSSTSWQNRFHTSLSFSSRTGSANHDA